MKGDKHTPLWLDLRQEYIDDNFDKLIVYLRNNGMGGSRDAFYGTTLELLQQRVTAVLDELSGRAVYDEIPRETLIYYLRLLAVSLLVSPNGERSLAAHMALLALLLELNRKHADVIAGAIAERLKNERIEVLGFSWDDVGSTASRFQLEVFAFKASRNVRFSKPLKTPLYVTKHGTAILSHEGLWLTAAQARRAQNLLSTGACSLETTAGTALVTPSADRLRLSPMMNLNHVEAWVNSFTSGQTAIDVKPVVRPELNKGDETVVEILGSEGERFIVRTVDPRYKQLAGEITFNHPNILYYNISTLMKHIHTGDVIPVTVEKATRGAARFSFEKQLYHYIVEDCRERVGYADTAAKFFQKNANTHVWLSIDGFPLYTRPSDGYQLGDYGVLTITEYCTGEHYGRIHATVLNEELTDDDKFDIEETRRLLLRDFVDATVIPADPEANAGPSFDATIMRLLTRAFFIYQQTLMRPLDRIALLANGRAMACLMGDDVNASFLKFTNDYLRILVNFATTDGIVDAKLTPDVAYAEAEATHVRMRVVDILKEYGHTGHSQVLADAIDDTTHPMLARLAQLIQTSNAMQGILSQASLNVIKREIIKTLSLETEQDANLEGDDSRYMGVESSTVEFKTSIAFPPDNNMQPNLEVQTRNVMRAICAFLNSSMGGTVYLGVNDAGYVCGLEEDRKYLKFKSIDDYTRRFIQDPAIDMLGLDAMTHITITPMMDNNVVAIHVEPHPYRVVELDGKAYVRVNNESREMSDAVKTQLIKQRVFTDRDKAAATSALQLALGRKCCVELHNYASSSSGTIRDYTVEPYDVLPADGLVVAYDIDAAKCKVFTIARIGHVKLLDSAWSHEGDHESMHIDAFHTAGNKPLRISLQLDMLARNLMIEEYPRTRDDITPQQGDPNTWYYNGTVYSPAGISRFYRGLQEHITILEDKDGVLRVES